jgi:thymidine kinase
MAEIHVYTGPMASGKTSKMLSILHKYSNITKERVLLINFSGDDRVKDCSSGISTHMYGDSSSKIPIGKYIDPIRVNNLNDLNDMDILNNYSMIGIDEAQFYPDLNAFIRKHIRSDIKFHISGLAYDSDNKIFGQISSLLDISTTFEKMTAICSKCSHKSMTLAGFTFSTKEKDSVISIGGMDMYTPLCLKHYLGILN